MGKLYIISGNLFDYLDGKDLIVNSANKYMRYGSGICGAIYNKANKNLLEDYCQNNFSQYMNVNETRITPGFNIGIDILHIYCPKYYQSLDPINEILESYYNIFAEANKNSYKNIISVSLGTGVHGYKHNDIADNIVNVLNKLVKEFNIDFTLVLPSDEICQLYKFYISKIASNIDKC